MECKLQALAGYDPGAAPDDWMATAQDLVAQAGLAAAEEIIAVAPILPGGLEEAQEVVSAMRQSPTTVRLDWAVLQQSRPRMGELPWERGARLAGELRASMGITSGPLANRDLEPLSHCWKRSCRSLGRRGEHPSCAAAIGTASTRGVRRCW